MNSFIITCCSTTDLPAAYFEERNVPYICFHYNLNGKEYPDDLGKTIPFETFYQMIADGATPTTSQINGSAYEEFWRPFLEEGSDILHISLSGGLSGSVNSARLTAESLMEQYPGRKILVIDSLGASSGSGLLVDKACDLRDEGQSMEQVADWIEKNKLRLHHWFFSTDLTSYIRGGRVSKTAGFFGTALKICPLLNMNTEGRLIPRMKVRTKKKVIQEIVKKMEDHAENGFDYSERCFISHSASREDAEEVARLVRERFPKIRGEILINSIGTVIGAHTGPGTVALFFFGDERTL